MSQIVHKVTCFITRDDDELLLFNHPEVGIQIPAGTVNPGEEFDLAARREAAEESGIKDLILMLSLGEIEDPPPPGFIFITHPTPVYSRPFLASNDWAHFRTGLPVELLRHQDGFSQVRFEETDRYLEPRYTTCSITGWVPDEALTIHRTRHFYLFIAPSPTPERWSVEVDNTVFELFWAPLNNLPEIVQPQADWLKWLIE